MGINKRETCRINMNISKLELIKLGIVTRTGRLSPIISRLLDINPEIVQRIVESTSFLTYSAPLKSRIHFILQRFTHQPVCKTCGAGLKMITSGRMVNTVGIYCSGACVLVDEDTKAKRNRTNVVKYGVANVMQSTVIKTKRSIH